MTNLTQYEKGCSPSAIQRKYGLTYVQGYELAESLKKTQELEAENTKLKELLKEVQSKIRYSSPRGIETFADLDDTLLGKINQVLGEE